MKRPISRRSFLKNSAIVLGAGTLSGLHVAGSVLAEGLNKSKVFFTKDISANGLLTIYSKINRHISGKTAIKLHTGEPNGPYILPREMVKALQQHIPNSALVIVQRAYHAFTLEKPDLTAYLVARFAEDVMAGRWRGKGAILLAPEAVGGDFCPFPAGFDHMRAIPVRIKAPEVVQDEEVAAS